jgi:septum formation protein
LSRTLVKPPVLILASSSPRREHFLRELGFRFRKDHPEVDERVRRGERPRDYVLRLAVTKAQQVAGRRPRSWVVAADTAVVVEGSILGKPRDDRDARRMLRKLSGRWHLVVSGIALVCREKRTELSRTSSTRVRFRKMTEEEIRWYVSTGEPSDKAGAYAIQGKGGLYVQRINGSPSNVIGFPVEAFYQLLLKAGWGQALHSCI